MDAIENLTPWTKPDYYAGFSPDGDYCIVTKNRESSLLEQSNFARITEDLIADAERLGEEPSDGEFWVYTWSARHWACGWVEYVMVRKDAPASLLEIAGEIVGDLEGYPVYDESHYSDLQCEEIAQYWERCGTRERMEWCRDAGVSIFAARSANVPEFVWDELYQSEMFY